MKKITKTMIEEIVDRALVEDVGDGDLTTIHTVPEALKARAVCRAKEPMVVCGLDVARTSFRKVDKGLKFVPHCNDGDHVKDGDVLFEVSGAARSILTGERLALNFVMYLSGMASITRRLVDITARYGVTVLDTRKTMPTLRALAKYAVRCGGGSNHRFGLWDGILIKENHLYATGVKKRNQVNLPELSELVARIKKATGKKVEVEVESLTEFEDVLRSGSDIIMLDNFSPEEVKRAVSLRNKASSPVKLEASGGINEQNLLAYARTRVDFISLGAMTHSVRSRDISLKVIY
jgi:nicotinate-nucleotide pyrophosphorylase (carboxylating)